MIALAANIESREWRRQFNTRNRIPAENPRASSTDDVECFFSMLRDTVGKDFTLKEVCLNENVLSRYMIAHLFGNVGLLWLEKSDRGVCQKNESQLAILLPYFFEMQIL